MKASNDMLVANNIFAASNQIDSNEINERASGYPKPELYD